MQTLAKVYTKDWAEDSVWVCNTPSKFALSSLFYIQEVGMFKCLPNYYTEHENISSFLVALTLSGSGQYIINSKLYEVKKGDLCFLDCMDYHSYKTGKTGKWDQMWIQMNGGAALGYFSQFAAQESPVISVGHGGHIADCLKQLIELNQNISMHTELLSSKLIVEILTEILILSGAVSTGDTDMPSFVRKAMQDIEAHFNENLNLDYFAQTLRISKFYFLKKFKKFTGYTPNEYIRLLRMNNAKKLLKFTDLNICEIAEKNGFQNPGYFINTFKKTTGMTPLQFRVKGQL